MTLKAFNKTIPGVMIHRRRGEAYPYYNPFSAASLINPYSGTTPPLNITPFLPAGTIVIINGQAYLTRSPIEAGRWGEMDPMNWHPSVVGPKKTGDTFVDRAPVYWDYTNNYFTSTSTAGPLVGVAMANMSLGTATQSATSTLHGDGTAGTTVTGGTSHDNIAGTYGASDTQMEVEVMWGWTITTTGAIAPTSITGGDSSLDITGQAGTGLTAAGGAVPITGGVGDTNYAGGAVSATGGAGAGTGAGGAASLAGGASGTGATGNGGAVSATGGAASSTNGTGGAASLIGGAGAGTGAGGAVTVTGGASGSGATGNGGAITATGGAASSTNGAGGAVSATGGAGAGTGAGGAIAVTGGASGAGATGNGGAASVTGGAASSTNGTGGAASLIGGLGTGTGAGGAVTITSGAAGATGVAGAVNISVGSATSGNGSAMTLTAGNGAGGTNAGGNLNLVPGTAVSTGTPGEVQVNSASGFCEASWSQFLAASVPVSGTSYTFFMANRAYRVKAVSVICSSSSTTPTVDVTKDTGTTAPGAGTSVLTGVITFSGTAHTRVTGTVSSTIATITLAAGDRLAAKWGGTVGSITGGQISVLLQPC